MPSLKNKPLPEKKPVKQIKAFVGSGVRLGSIVEETKESG
jgi:hypothetical protein